MFAYDLNDPNLPRINRLAESYWWLDTTTLQVKLREGVLFHDGTPFNASAAKWNFDRLLYLTNCSGTNTGNVTATQTLWMLPDGVTPIISDVSAVGDWNITITLNAPYAAFIDLLSFINAAMLSPTSTSTNQLIDLSSGQVIGTGPFKYEYYLSGIEVYFTRWDNYWQTPAFFEEMSFIFFPDSPTLNNAMLSYDIDYLLNPLYAFFPSFDADPNITLKRYSDDTGKTGFTYYFLGFNNQLYNVTWRKVMSLAINYTYMLDEILIGNAIRANSPISPSFGDAYNASAMAANFDIATARLIMQSMGFGVGFTTDAEWIAQAEGSSPFLTLNFTYNLGNVIRADMYSMLNNDFKLLGIKLEEAALSYSDYINRLFNIDDGWNKLCTFISGWMPDYLEPYNMLYPLFTPGSLGNPGQVDDPWLNAQLALAINTLDDNARNDIYKDIQSYLAEVGYFQAPLYHPKIYFVHLSDIQGVPYHALGELYAYPIHRALPSTFLLSSDAGVPDNDGNFNINWTASMGATNYSVYEYSSYITEINGSLTSLADEITDLGLYLSGYPDGTYYFIVVAHNEYGDTLSNCISVTVALPLNHDLEVDLLLPSSIDVNMSYIIYAMVENIGLNDETGVQLFLYLDEVLVNSTPTFDLDVGQTVIIQYNWTPSEYRAYNFTVYAPPVPLESYVDNNIQTRFAYVVKAGWLDGLYITHRFGQMGAFYETNFSYVPYIGGLYNESFEIAGMVNYTWQVDPQTRVMSGGSLFGDGYHTPAWIFTNTSLYDIIPIAVDGDGDHDFYVAREFLYDLSGFGLVEVWELEDLTEPGGLAWYEKSTGILLNGTFFYGGGVYYYVFEFVDTNANFKYIVFDHEIKVFLDIPSIVEANNSYVITATVINNGLYSEADVELFLYLDKILVNSTIIPSLGVGMSQSIEYIWTPTEYRAYNFTAIAPAVPLESYLDNNRITNIIYIIETKLFDGLYIKHIFNLMGTIYNTNVTYSYYNGRLFYETLNLEYMGMTMAYPWMVDALTRVMSGASLFGNGQHSPFWLFTDISLYDTIPIGIFGEGDHNFYVARDLIYNLPGFGPVDVWELEDLTQPGGLAWYEKSTGILLSGTFFFGGGVGNYTFDFVDTNTNLAVVESQPPGNFTLSSNAGSPDTDGNFDLVWTASSGADDYSIYRSSSFITTITGSLTLLADDISALSMALSGYADGTYYFIVVAHNSMGDTLSNCISVTVSKPGIPGYNVMVISAVLGITVALIIKKKYRMK
ncbi:MAG: ABC transporter substrate-binding protein [Promethearchaeota archaeon]